VWHPGPKPRYALITSWASDDVLDGWISRERGNKSDPAARKMASARP
jgi:hypothetical protein